ncbi:hypothetical protein AYR54_00400 [Loigolactobacillus backii]|uniref:MucBP domain-containing protein n=1 Tax=Loigolactobacillus backii TaxID=375175 RepID=UPI0007F11829|nr:MucBP domain-containing protein [Loigolactobacillus backii]ANK63847.1 hypothetical protein AYR54_00400 [Loigolactobacillus backii]ANK66295.1 hypothetical protein AYR55_00400 [Loigolactobacillus backii]OLF69324.1 hypothetical protein ACX53_08470 [Loigolactobacillus backii]PIO86409.1 hypothetical protein B8A32_04195 [Loigolactobacillus backii]
MRNVKENKLRAFETQTKLHYKMYKSGKRWLFAGLLSIAFFGGGFLNQGNVHAAVNNESNNVNKSDQVTIAPTNSNQGQVVTLVNSAATAESAVPVATSVANTSAMSSDQGSSASTQANSAAPKQSTANSQIGSKSSSEATAASSVANSNSSAVSASQSSSADAQVDSATTGSVADAQINSKATSAAPAASSGANTSAASTDQSSSGKTQTQESTATSDVASVGGKIQSAGKSMDTAKYAGRQAKIVSPERTAATNESQLSELAVTEGLQADNVTIDTNATGDVSPYENVTLSVAINNLSTNTIPVGTELDLTVDSSVLSYASLQSSELNLPDYLAMTVDTANNQIKFKFLKTISTLGEVTIKIPVFAVNNSTSVTQGAPILANILNTNGTIIAVPVANPIITVTGNTDNSDSSLISPYWQNTASYTGTNVTNFVGTATQDGTKYGLFKLSSGEMDFQNAYNQSMKLGPYSDVTLGFTYDTNQTLIPDSIRIVHLGVDVTDQFANEITYGDHNFQINLGNTTSDAIYLITYAVKGADPNAQYLNGFSIDYTKPGASEPSHYVVNLNSAFAKVGTNGFYPSLEVSNQVVDYDVDYNLKNTATANDIEDGDITSNIVVKDDGGFDTKQSGSYNVTYAVTDKDGNETDQTVTVTVKAVANVQYEDEAGNSLGTGSAVYPDGAFVGKSYTTSPGTIAGYTYERLANGSAAASGKLTTTPQTVIYVYQQNGAAVTVQYEDEQGNSLGIGSAAYPDGTFVGKSYTTSPGTISGYTYDRLATGSAAATGTLTTTPQTVTYVYQQNGAAVTVQYEDEQGNSLGTGSAAYPDGTFVGKSYTTSPGTVSGYTYDRLATGSAAATGTLTTTPQTVTHVYQQNPVKAATVTVQYEDEQGNSLGTGSAAYPDGAFVGKGYTTSPGTVSGYTYERLGNGSAAASGKLTTTPQTVTYVYQQNPVKAATVTVQYEDEQGNSLGTGSASYPDGAFVGKGYTTDSKTITGYTYDRLATGSAAATGTLTTTPQTVTYVYQQNPVKAATVTVQYEDEQGNSLGTGSTVYPDGAFVGKGYTTSPGTIAGYTYERLAAGSAAATGTLTTTPQTVTYVYQRVTAVQPTVPTQSQPTTKATKKVVASKISTKKIPVTGKTSTKLVKTKQLVTGFTNKKVKQAATTTKAVPVVEKNKMTKLPQTGETQAQSSSALGVLLLELSGLLMFGFKKRKN